ncbi:MAG: ABC transporter permease [Methylococcus sp.]|nr:ABC transporter permease [Methylococcus sp.]
MNLAQNFRLALRLAKRDWRGGELSILLTALAIAVAATAAIHLFGDRLARTMVEHAAEFIAGDLTVTSHRQLPDEWRTEARALGLRDTASVEFPSVLMENHQILLGGIKAVSAGYPLRGEVRTRAADTAAEQTAQTVPVAGTVWVEQRVLGTLGLGVGSPLTVGSAQLRIARILSHEPDRRGDLYSLSPRVLMNLDDLPATRVIQPGSRVHRYAMFAGDETTVRRFKTWLKPRLERGDRLLDVHEDRPEVGGALDRAERYLGMASVMVVLIAGVAIGMSARRYTERHYDTTALLKCLGAGKRDIFVIYVLILSVLGLPVAMLGSALGYLAQAALAQAIAGLLPHSLAQPGWEGVLLAPLTGLVILAGFALPPLLGLTHMAPLRVLRRDLAPNPPGAWLSQGFALAALGALLLRPARDPVLVLLILGGGVLILFGFRLWIGGMLKLVPRLMRNRNLTWRLGFHNLLRRPQLVSFQVIGFGLALAAMLIAYIVQSELVMEWKHQLPDDAPNFFALNLQEDEIERFRQFLDTEKLVGSRLYPIVRGRLVRVDGVDVRRLAAKDSQAEAAIERDLSLTWSDSLPPDNHVVEGRWGASGLGRVSVEQKLAGELGIRPGARLAFDVAGKPVEAVVDSLRNVRWDSMTPNFYVIFSPGSLQDQPRTYLTSFYVPPQRTEALNALVKAFPAMTLLDVDALLKQFQSILQQVTLAVEAVLGFAVFAGFTVLFGAVHATANERMKEDTLLRAIGAEAALLRRSQWIEFAVLGALAGLMAVVAAEVIAAVVFSQVMHMAPHFHGWLWIAAPLTGALSIGWAGTWSVRRAVNARPADVLRELA